MGINGYASGHWMGRAPRGLKCLPAGAVRTCRASPSPSSRPLRNWHALRNARRTGCSRATTDGVQASLRRSWRDLAGNPSAVCRARPLSGPGTRCRGTTSLGPASAVHTRLVNARIVLVVDESSPVARLVEALASLEYPSLPQHALIGGLAVMCRLATAHRPTADVDTLARDDAIPTVAEVLVARGATRTSTGVELAGVKIDILEVGDLPPPAALPEDDLARAFVLAHSWALATAEPARIDARSPEGRTFASAQLEVATPAALVAMKLHAINQRGHLRRSNGVARDILGLELTTPPATHSLLAISRGRPARTAVTEAYPYEPAPYEPANDS